MKTYDKFLDYYDQIVRWINSPIDEETDFLENEVIKTHNPEAKDILEVACWTGIVAKELIKLGYNYTWLDINESEAKFKKFRKKIDFVRYDEF